MLLIGLKEITTGTGISENDYSSVSHQRTDIIAGSPADTAETLGQLYHAMVRKAKQSERELVEIKDELEWREVSNEEFEEIENRRNLLRADLKILKYDKVLIIDGIILK
jgi:hypothetical protein